MVEIIVTSNPDPDYPYPPEVIKAFQNLRLPVQSSLEPGNKIYPQGVHLVLMVEVLRAFCLLDPKVYEQLLELWQPILRCTGADISRVCIPFPFDCCEAIN